MLDEVVRGEPRASRRDLLEASPPMFGSPLLDRLTRSHPAVPALIYGPAIALLVLLALRDGAVGRVALELLGGYLGWTLIEYWVHRTVFHLEPTSAFGARLHWMIHGVHHDHPNDRRRLVFPPVLSLPLALLFLGLFVLVLGRPAGLAVTAGLYAGYLVYDMLHFALHHHRPTTRLGRRLHELHMRHHFEDHERGFGVSAPWWDIVFRTAPRRSGDGGRA
jgi:sterol desaturase/sphingolipid hydroxylase (fatty acid hydroxylase superfamily)